MRADLTNLDNLVGDRRFIVCPEGFFPFPNRDMVMELLAARVSVMI